MVSPCRACLCFAQAAHKKPGMKKTSAPLQAAFMFILFQKRLPAVFILSTQADNFVFLV
jgi:hypothetical protein